MSLLSTQLSQTEPGAVLVRIENPGLEMGAPSKLPFVEDVALPAVLKALEATSFCPQDFTDDELAWLRKENFVVDSRDRSYYSQQMTQKIGQSLFHCLFPNEKMRGIYDQVRRQSTEANEEVHFQLRFDASAPLVGAYPWELLYHEGDFLIGGGKGTLTRYITFDTPPATRGVSDGLKVLLITPRPYDPELALLNHAEERAVRQGVERAKEKGWISLEAQDVSSFSVLESYLSEHSGDDAPHVIHFDGHGAFGRRCPQCGIITQSRVAKVCRNPECPRPLGDVKPQGYLVFQGAHGRSEYVSAQEFADLLRQAGVSAVGDRLAGISLVVLSACRSAVARGGGSVFNGVAQRLMDARVPAVVAMQFSIRADKAAVFAEHFYRSIAKGEPLVTAVSWGRTVLGREGDQWYRPVLYLRWRDNEGGRLFSATLERGDVPTRPTDTPGLGPRPSKPATIEPAITPRQKDELVEALLNCPTIINRDTREAVVQDLPDSIQRNIRDSPQLNVAVRNIVATCLNFQNGIKDLVESVRRYEGDSIPMQRLDELVG
jgi:hypothetical protein